MAAPKKSTTRKASTRKASTKAKRSPRMVVATAKGRVTEPKVGDPKRLEAAVTAAKAAKDAAAKRDQAIRAAVKSGTSARQVALAVGLTHPGVLKIVKR
jgi:hypothetical protein